MLAVTFVLYQALNFYWWIVIASAILSWLYAFNIINAGNPVVDAIGTFLYKMTEPVYRRIRRFMPAHCAIQAYRTDRSRIGLPVHRRSRIEPGR